MILYTSPATGDALTTFLPIAVVVLAALIAAYFVLTRRRK